MFVLTDVCIQVFDLFAEIFQPNRICCLWLTTNHYFMMSINEFESFHCSEPPYFLRRPEDTLAVAGTDATLSCQVRKLSPTQSTINYQAFFAKLILLSNRVQLF